MSAQRKTPAGGPGSQESAHTSINQLEVNTPNGGNEIEEPDVLSAFCPACGGAASWPDCEGCGHDLTTPAPEGPRTFDPSAELPEELTERPQWICWKSVQRSPGSKPDKVPCSPSGGPLARWQSDPAQWLTHEDAVAAYQANPSLAGIGIVMTPDSGLIGIDMDGAIDLATGDIAPWATEHVADLDTYTEVSPSGTGFRAFVLGTLPADAPKKRGNREIYDRGRWLTITGKVWNDAPIREAPEAVARYLAAMGGAQGDATSTTARTGGATGNAQLIQAILTGENLHDSTRDLAFRLIDDGLTPSKVVEIVRGTMLAMPSRGDPARWQARHDDIPRMVAGAVAKTQVAATGWRVEHVGGLLAQPQPTKWIVRDIMGADSLAVLFGASGSGKSFVALDLAACVATGTAWHGHRVTQGAVVYMAGEGRAGALKRLIAWGIEHGKDLGQAPLYVSSAPIGLSGAADHVVRTIREACPTPPVLVIIDTLARHLPLGADENSGVDMNSLIAAADVVRQAFGCAVQLIHHTGHGPQDRERGSSTLRAALDFSFSTQKAGSGPIEMWARKLKDCELPSEPLRFNLHQIELPWTDDEGEQETSAVLRPATAGRQGANQVLAVGVLRRLAGDGGWVEVRKWRKETGLDRRRWPEVLRALTEQGTVLIDGDLARLPDAAPSVRPKPSL